MEAPILIVDDEEQIRTTLRGILQDEGFRTLETDSGENVLDLVAAWQPCLVLLDIWMPHVDGIALLGTAPGSGACTADYCDLRSRHDRNSCPRHKTRGRGFPRKALLAGYLTPFGLPAPWEQSRISLPPPG